MFKKSVIAALLSLVLAIVLSTSAFAAEEAVSAEIAEALAEIEEVNTEIYAEIAETQAEAEELYAEYQSESAEETDADKRAALKVKYDSKVTALIEALDAKTQEMTRKGVDKARAAGITVEVEWITVQFADRVALIDPMVVIDW